MSKSLKERVLVIDDEPDLLELIEVNLKGAGYDVLVASNGKDGLRAARQMLPELIVLDVMLPELSGLEVCKSLRHDPATIGIPILMLTARAAEIDRVLGLELGADDYVTKPFSTRELVLRVKNLLRRKTGGEADDSQIQIGGLSIDRARHRICFKGRPLDLTLTEFKLVTVLAQRRGRVQSRDQLLKDVWGYSSLIDTRTVDTHMRRLRHKLGGAARYLDTVRGVGYRFVEFQP
ncbi:MAG TPA: response regulator [Candidatus Baltobacteraceae bacterium]|jgi:two-component system phosphate regulon response regulator PhoB|nr:response regulator [Candidatus Baltobacteraceae bacterium]